jgi:glycosyltransferase involved in cell wall biosynthesis
LPPVRVLLVSQEMPPETGWGGIGTYVATLAPALAAAGAEVHVLSVVRGQEAGDRRIGEVVVHRRPLKRPPGIGRATRMPETWERLSLAAAVAREERALEFAPDVVEAPEWRAEGLIVALRHTIPVVVRLHSAAEQLFPYSGRAGIDSRLASWLERRSIAAAELVVSTPSNLDELTGRLPGRDLITRAVNLPVPRADPAGPLPPVPRVTFVGRLERRKGPETLIAAARAVLDDVPEARFSFVGADTGGPSGSYREMLAAEARRSGVDHAVEFIGYRSHDEVMAEIRRSWVCAFPSRQETFGYGPAEAASVGRAVVASRIAPFRTLFGDEGAHLVAPGEAPAWGAALTALLREPDRARELAAAGRARVRDQCAPERIAAQMLDVYALAQRRSRSQNRSGGSPTRVA